MTGTSEVTIIHPFPPLIFGIGVDEEGKPITKVMYQNEAYSYTPYPGCAWTAEETLRFNNEYLAPTLAKKHPEVDLWIGTFNTNRLDYVEKILDNKTL